MFFKRLKLLKELTKDQANIQIGVILRTYMIIPLAALTGKVWANRSNIPSRRKL